MTAPLQMSLNIVPSANAILGRNLIKLRSAKGVSQSKIGETSPVSQKTVSNIEKMGEAGSANLETMEALAEYFKVPVWQLLLEDMPMDPAMRRRLNEAVAAMLGMSEASLIKVLDRIEEVALLDGLSRNS